MAKSKHDHMLELLKPLVSFLDENEFSYLIVAGKDGTCSRYANGQKTELASMIKSTENPDLKEFFNDLENLING